MEKNGSVVNGKNAKFKLTKDSILKNMKVKIAAISVAMSIVVTGGIVLTNVNKNKFNINLDDYDKVVRPYINPVVDESVTENIKYISYSDEVSLSYNFTPDYDTGLHMHPNNATLIDVDPKEEYKSDKIFQECKSALIYNFNGTIDDINIDALSSGKITKCVNNYDDNTPYRIRYHMLYKVMSREKGMLVAPLNLVPYRRVSEKAALKAHNSERFTDVHIRVGEKKTTFNTFVGVNHYVKDDIKLDGLVILGKDKQYYEYFVLADQYVLEGKYNNNELKGIQKKDILFEEASVLPGIMDEMKDVYLVFEPIVLSSNAEPLKNDRNVAYLQTADNRVFKAIAQNVYLTHNRSVIDSNEIPHISTEAVKVDSQKKDIKYNGIDLDEFYAIDNDEYSYKSGDVALRASYFVNGIDTTVFPNSSAVISYQPIANLEKDGFTMVKTPTVATINLPNIEEKIEILAYRIMSLKYPNGDDRIFDGEYISIAFKTNTIMTDSLCGEYVTCYTLPIEAVIFASTDLDIGYSVPNVKRR